MGYKYTGDAILGVSLTVNTPKPLDSRSVVENLSELYTIPENTAYRGMTVANIDNGNIYMLVDKSKIKEKAGWKASYESIQIITCTEQDYNLWKKNTTEDYKPIDENLTYLHADTYYYIYEESIEEPQQYLGSQWGKNIEELLSGKASAQAVTDLLIKVNSDIDNLKNNYLTKNEIVETYATKLLLQSTIEDTIANYYTKEESDSKFVTKEDLRGEATEGEDDFIFVTQYQYNQDQQKLQEELDKTLKVDGEGQLESITVGEIKSPIVEGQEQLVVSVKSDGLHIGEDTVAVQSDIPVLITLSENEYRELEESNSLQSDVYYYLYDTSDSNLVYVTKKDLDASYSTTSSTQAWVSLNFYQRKELDDILKGLQPVGEYITSELILLYYTIELIDSKFYTIENANKTFATKTELETLSTTITENFVTKEDLKGSDTEDEDFIFVTLTQYNKDKDAQAVELTTGNLMANSTTISEVNILKIEEKELELNDPETGETTTIIESEVTSSVKLTTESNRLMAGNEQLAFTSEVPKIEYLSTEEYTTLVENSELDSETYYYTYDATDNPENGYVTNSQLTLQYYTKHQVNQLIAEEILKLVARIKILEAYHTTQEETPEDYTGEEVTTE